MCQRHRAGPWLADLRRLAHDGKGDTALAAELSRLHAPRRWTADSVRHWRKHLALGPDDPPSDRGERRRLYQAARGWGHLLPAWDEARRAWGPGHELHPAETDILCFLRDHGPQTRRQLRAAGCKLWAWVGRPRDLPRRLETAGLVTRQGIHPGFYAVAGAARPRARAATPPASVAQILGLDESLEDETVLK